MKGRAVKILRAVGVTLVSVLLATIAINAADNADNLSQSFLGILLAGGGREKGACPSNMVYITSAVGSFCIDAYEVSASDVCPNKMPQSVSETQVNLDQPDCKPESKSGAMPWTNVTRHQAEAACRKEGKRLPTNREWFEAALGTPDATSSLCNIGQENTGVLLRTGEKVSCISSSATYDMVGNVWEWVSEIVQDGVANQQSLPEEGYIHDVSEFAFPTVTDPNLPDPLFGGDYLWVNRQGSVGMFRGGYWGSDERSGVFAIYAYSPPTFSGNAVGFRCVQ